MKSIDKNSEGRIKSNDSIPQKKMVRQVRDELRRNIHE